MKDSFVQKCNQIERRNRARTPKKLDTFGHSILLGGQGREGEGKLPLPAMRASRGFFIPSFPTMRRPVFLSFHHCSFRTRLDGVQRNGAGLVLRDPLELSLLPGAQGHQPHPPDDLHLQPAVLRVHERKGEKTFRIIFCIKCSNGIAGSLSRSVICWIWL